MFSSAKIRIKEGARRARTEARRAIFDPTSATTASGRDQSSQVEGSDSMENHGKGLANGKAGGGGLSSSSHRFDRMMEREDNYMDMMDLGDFDDAMSGGNMDMDEIFSTLGGPSGMPYFGMSGSSAGGHRRMHMDKVDKVVHTDFFNKFDDLLDLDDLD